VGVALKELFDGGGLFAEEGVGWEKRPEDLINGL
jgi:hypothetical protein